MSSSYSSLDWVLSHWAHFIVSRFICVYVCVFLCYLVILHYMFYYCNTVGWTWWDVKPYSAYRSKICHMSIHDLFDLITMNIYLTCYMLRTQIIFTKFEIGQPIFVPGLWRLRRFTADTLRHAVTLALTLWPRMFVVYRLSRGQVLYQSAPELMVIEQVVPACFVRGRSSQSWMDRSIPNLGRSTNLFQMSHIFSVSKPGASESNFAPFDPL